MKRRILIAIPLAVGIFIGVWAIGAIKNEALTALYGESFRYGYKETGVIADDPVRMKVLDYSEKHARVYYVHSWCGNIIRFSKKDTSWEMSGWETVWSTMGNADGFVWPYVWDSQYGRFKLLLYGIPTAIALIVVLLLTTRRVKKPDV